MGVPCRHVIRPHIKWDEYAIYTKQNNDRQRWEEMRGMHRREKKQSKPCMECLLAPDTYTADAMFCISTLDDAWIVGVSVCLSLSAKISLSPPSLSDIHLHRLIRAAKHYISFHVCFFIPIVVGVVRLVGLGDFPFTRMSPETELYHCNTRRATASRE